MAVSVFAVTESLRAGLKCAREWFCVFLEVATTRILVVGACQNLERYYELEQTSRGETSMAVAA